MKKQTVLLNVPVTGEAELKFVCDKECKKLHSLLFVIEKELGVNLRDYPNIRKEILDSSNFIKRMPDMISDIISTEVGETGSITHYHKG